jgi:DNA-3-methyladenine glycosylase II
MPATRSSSRIASIPLFPVKKPGPAGSPTKKKRASATDKDVPVAKRSKSTPTVRSSPTTVQTSVSSQKAENTPKALPTFNLKPAHLDPTRVIPANLGFDFQQAKRHLIGVDPRFGKVFETLPCRPFEDLESVDPFRLV